MENASKALVIAGGVLLAILIASIGISLKGNLGKSADAYVQKLDTVELQKYNTNFEVYADNTRMITAQDIITLIGIVEQKKQDTRIFINNVDCTSYTEQQKSEFLSNNILTHNKDGTIINSFVYDEVDHPIQYDEEGKVIEIGFKKKT